MARVSTGFSVNQQEDQNRLQILEGQGSYCPTGTSRSQQKQRSETQSIIHTAACHGAGGREMIAPMQMPKPTKIYHPFSLSNTPLNVVSVQLHYRVL